MIHPPSSIYLCLLAGLMPAMLPAQDLARDLADPEPDLWASESDVFESETALSPPGNDLFAPEVTAPSGFSGIPVVGGRFGETWTDRARDGWSFGGLSTTLYYTNNASSSARGGFAGQGPRPDAGAGGDTVLSVSTGASYRSPNPDLWLGGSVNLGYAHYFSNADYSGPTYGASLEGGFGGGRLTGTGSLSFNFNRGGNRNVGGFTEQLSVGLGLSAQYAYSAKTSISASYGTQLISAQSGNSTDSNSHSFSVSANWQATPLTSIGAGLSASFQGGGGRQDRTTLGPSFSVNYQLSQKVVLNSSFGLGFVTGGGGGDSVDYNMSLGATYNASELWGMDLTLFGGTVPDNGFGGGYRDTWSLRLGYHRQVLWGSQLSLGVSWETSSQNTSSRAAPTNGDRDFWSFDASLSRSIPGIRGSGSIFFSYQDQTGNGAAAFDSYTVGVSVSKGF